jgi:hypothetical protein
MITINHPTVRASGDLHDSGGKFEAVGPQSEREARHLKPGVNRFLDMIIMVRLETNYPLSANSLTCHGESTPT